MMGRMDVSSIVMISIGIALLLSLFIFFFSFIQFDGYRGMCGLRHFMSLIPIDWWLYRFPLYKSMSTKQVVKYTVFNYVISQVVFVFNLYQKSVGKI